MELHNCLRRLGCALLAALLLPGVLPAAGAVDSSGSVTYLTAKFDSPAYPGRELSCQFPYSDDYFTIPANDYQHQLAQCTLGMAVSAFRAADLELERKDAYIRDYLGQAGFGNVVSHQFDQVPSADTIATCIASKPMQDAEGEFLLVAAAVSGGGYEDEWLSNFSFGDESVHEGFFSAAFDVFQRVFDYVDQYAGEGRFKLWMGGYSRAAAVSNMAAALSLMAGQVANEDLYVYTFATPNNIHAASSEFELDGAVDYSNIYNVTGMFDPVPSIPFQEWGYDKLGTTFRLPAQETTPDYAQRRVPVAEIYQEITGSAYSNNPEANWFIQKLYQLIYDMVRTADQYQQQLQGVIDQAWANRSDTWGLLRALCGVLSSNSEFDAMLAGEFPDADTLLSVFLYDVAMEKLGLRPSSWNDLSVMMQLFYEHCPEVYVSWMMSQDDPSALFVADTGYRRIFMDGSISFTLMDEDRQPVDAVCAAGLGNTRMITVPAGRTWILSLSGGKAGGRVKVVEYSAGSLHYAYQIYTMDQGDGSYELTLPMEFWNDLEDGSLIRVPDNQAVAPTVQALEREDVHPSAVFELEDSGFLASYVLNIALIAVIVLLLAVIAALVILVVFLVRRGRKKAVQTNEQKGDASYESTIRTQ